MSVETYYYLANFDEEICASPEYYTQEFYDEYGLPILTNALTGAGVWPMDSPMIKWATEAEFHRVEECPQEVQMRLNNQTVLLEIE